MILALFCFNSLLYAEPTNEDFAKLDQLNTDWMNTFNSENGDLSRFYNTETLFFPAKKNFIKGNSVIGDYFLKLKKTGYKLVAITPVGRYRVNSIIIYETGNLVSDKTKFNYLVIWKRNGVNWFRELRSLCRIHYQFPRL